MSNDFKEFTEEYQNSATLWFGKYKHIPISEIPKDYLVWVRYKSGIKMSKSLKRALTANIPVDMRIRTRKSEWKKKYNQ